MAVEGGPRNTMGRGSPTNSSCWREKLSASKADATARFGGEGLPSFYRRTVVPRLGTGHTKQSRRRFRVSPNLLPVRPGLSLTTISWPLFQIGSNHTVHWSVLVCCKPRKGKKIGINFRDGRRFNRPSFFFDVPHHQSARLDDLRIVQTKNPPCPALADVTPFTSWPEIERPSRRPVQAWQAPTTQFQQPGVCHHFHFNSFHLPDPARQSQ